MGPQVGGQVRVLSVGLVYKHYLECFWVEDCFFSSVYSITYLYQQGLVDINIIFWIAVGQHVLHCSLHIIPVLAIGNSLILTLPSLMHLHYFVS